MLKVARDTLTQSSRPLIAWAHVLEMRDQTGCGRVFCCEFYTTGQSRKDSFKSGLSSPPVLTSPFGCPVKQRPSKVVNFTLEDIKRLSWHRLGYPGDGRPAIPGFARLERFLCMLAIIQRKRHVGRCFKKGTKQALVLRSNCETLAVQVFLKKKGHVSERYNPTKL